MLVNQSQVSTQLSLNIQFSVSGVNPAAFPTNSQPVAEPTVSSGWIRADKSAYHKKKMFPCDLCGFKCDSVAQPEDTQKLKKM